MKRRLFIAVVLALTALSGCQDFRNHLTDTHGDIENFTVKVIDGCEYLEYDYGIVDQRVYSLTHKGNCKNPIHECGSPPPPLKGKE